MIWAVTIGVAFLALIILGRVHTDITKRQKANGTYSRKFIYVNEDGTAHELSPDQIEHLNTEYQFGDGNRPYIKSRYKQLTPDGKIWGYLPRRKLPRRIRINSD